MKKILIVDDTKSWQYFTQETLTELYGNELQIITKESAREALRCVHEHIEAPFDLIISDLQMEQDYHPLTAGEWLIRNLKMIKEYKEVPVIVISAMPEGENAVKQLNADFISKQKLVNNKLLLKYAVEKTIM